jgi:hypothetical protein
MGFFSFLLMQLMAAYTVLVEPFLRTNFYRMLKKQLNIDATARILFYRTQVLWEWSWVVVIAVIFIPNPEPLQRLGLVLPTPLGWIIMGALLLGIGLSTVLLRRNLGAMDRMRRSLEATSILLPSTPRERKWFAATAITTGICEELLYRGLLIYDLRILFPGLDWIFSAILSGIIYGLSRAFLGQKGILQTALNGFSFAIVYFLSGNLLSAITSNQPLAIAGSLLPAMVFHALAELRTLYLWQPVDNKKTK